MKQPLHAGSATSHAFLYDKYHTLCFEPFEHVAMQT